ncbi:MAG: class I tRNA ligase family protein, partial [Armatimonadetes bacterium]|nr:class I tRNA ligase family protein [Armatimonadota bacterium]
KIQNSKFKIPKEFIETLLLLLAPMAPHICEELWSQFHPDLYKNKSYTIFNEKWPSYNSDLIIDKVAQIVIQINGKLRDVVKIDTNISEQDLLKIVKERPKILKYIRDKEIKKIIFVRGKLMNLVVV